MLPLRVGVSYDRAGGTPPAGHNVSVIDQIRLATRHQPAETHDMSIGTILLIILVLFLVGALPTWPHSANWGYFPSGGLGVVLIIVVVLVFTGRI